MKLGLMVTDGCHAGQVITANGVCLAIGRDPQCQVRPNSPAISQRHCVLMQRADRAFVRDLDSRTGTFLNERQLRGEIELRDGDFLQVGPLVFVVQLQAEPLVQVAALTTLDTGTSTASLSESATPDAGHQESPAGHFASAMDGMVAAPQRTCATWVGTTRPKPVPNGLPVSRKTMLRLTAGSRYSGEPGTRGPAKASLSECDQIGEPLHALTARIDSLKEELSQTEPDLDFDLLRAAGVVDDPPAADVDDALDSNPEVSSMETVERAEPQEVTAHAASPGCAVAETEPPPTEATEAQALTEPTKQQAKPRCPRCPGMSLLSWNHSVLCCTGCWTWFKIDSNGKPTEVSPPANADQAVLRLRDESGQCRAVRVPPGIVQQRRREWTDQHRWRLAGLFTIRQLVGAALLAGVVLAIFLMVRGRSSSREGLQPRLSDARATKTGQKALRSTTDDRNRVP